MQHFPLSGFLIHCHFYHPSQQMLLLRKSTGLLKMPVGMFTESCRTCELFLLQTASNVNTGQRCFPPILFSAFAVTAAVSCSNLLAAGSPCKHEAKTPSCLSLFFFFFFFFFPTFLLPSGKLTSCRSDIGGDVSVRCRFSYRVSTGGGTVCKTPSKAAFHTQKL